MVAIDLGIHFFNSEAEAMESGYGGELVVHEQQFILVADYVMNEAARRAQELKEVHENTIKREVTDLVPLMIIDMFAEGWKPTE